MTNKIEEFIQRRFPVDCNWMDGNCYWFAEILCLRFKELDVYYLPIQGHFIAGNKDTNEYYDWSGRVYPKDEEIISFMDMLIRDPLWYSRIVRDCVN